MNGEPSDAELTRELIKAEIGRLIEELPDRDLCALVLVCRERLSDIAGEPQLRVVQTA